MAWQTFKNGIRIWVLVLIFLPSSSGLCGEEMDSTAKQGNDLEMQGESHFNMGTWLASLFRDHISAVDGNRCPSLPSCSSYSVQAFEKHGFIMGWLMTVDRLIHEADEPSVSPVVIHQGRAKTIDPLENNDFWWFHEHDAEKE